MTKQTPRNVVEELSLPYLDSVNDRLTDAVNDIACEVIEKLGFVPLDADLTDLHALLTDQAWDYILEQLKR